MADKREESRQRWEQEIVTRQQNITPADFPEGLHYAKFARLPKIISQMRFWIGVILIAAGVAICRSAVPTVVPVASIAGGLCLAASAMR